MAKQQRKVSAGEKEVRIEPVIPADIVSRYANIFSIQVLEGNYVLSFFAAFPPVILSAPETQAEIMAKVESIPAECVAQVIVPPSRIPEIVRALNDVGEQHQTVTDNNTGPLLHISEPPQIGGLDELITKIEEAATARNFAAALANVEPEDQFNGLAYAIASQEVLARDWLTPEDDIDWTTWISPGEE